MDCIEQKNIITSLSETLSDDNTNEHNNNYVTNEHNNEHVINDDNEYVINKHDSDDVNISIPEGSSSMKQPPKLNLKDLQLVPINKIVRCLFKINRINRLQLCGHLMRSTDTSTGNFIGYLVSRHGIMKESYKLQQQQSKQKNIDEDQLPINIQEGADAFLSSKEHLKEMLITCIFIDNDFQLNKIVLTLKYLPYSHIAEAIAKALNFIIDDWKLTNKNAILLLTEVLRPFAEVTELLGSSKYATISFMYSAIVIIKQGLLSFSKTSDMDFDSADDVFENDVIYEDEDENRIQED
ncbi:17099_t:CDS:2, partial [Cetraspora pellucida]